MTAFDPSTAGGFDPSSAKPVAPPGGFDPNSAKPLRLLPANPVVQTAKNIVKGVEDADVGLAARWNAIKRHPLTTGMDFLGSLQRGVGGIAEAIEGHQDFKTALHTIGQDVFMTREGTPLGHGISDAAAQAVRARTTESIRAAVHAPTHQAIDQLVNGAKWIPAAAKPYVSGIMKGGEDIGLQTVSDPVSLVGGVVFRGIGSLVKVAKTFEEAHNVASVMGLGNAFAHLKPLYQGSAALAQHIADTPLVSFFRTRPELDNFAHGAAGPGGKKLTAVSGGFTEQGKKIRMQLEQKVGTQANADRAIDDALTTAADRENRLKDYIAQYGDASARAKLSALGHPIPAGAANAYLSKSSGIGSDVGAFLSKFRSMTAEEQAEVLRTVRNDARDGSLAKKTESAVRLWNTAGTKTDQILKPGSVISDFRKVPSETQVIEDIKRVGQSLAPIKAIRDIQRTAIFLNPLPHGIKNVGELAFMAGGFPAVFRGFKAMATGAIDSDRLRAMGALPEYTQHGLNESFWGKVVPGWANVAGKMQSRMERMEQGWRQGLLETIDKKLGTSGGLKDELLKGHMLQEHLGDYTNQSAMVHAFAAMGGPFAAFRLGIVPKALLRTVAQDPQRILLALRTKYGLSNQPNAHGDELVTGGPTDDFGKMLSDPLGFFLSPSTTGIFGMAAQQLAYGQHDTPLQAVGRQLHLFNPASEVIDILGAIANGARPGGKENVADKLVDVTMLLFGAYFKREQAAKTIAANAKQTANQARKNYKPVMSALDSLGGAGQAAPASAASGFDPSTAGSGGGFDPTTAR